MQTISERIFEIIDDRGISQREFSRMTGIATTTISDWRKKGTNPASDKIMVICTALSVTPDWLLSGIEPNSNYERRRETDYVIISKDSQEYKLLEAVSDMETGFKNRILEYIKEMKKEKNNRI